MKPLMRFLLFNLVFFIMQNALAQNPLVKMWDKRFGGTDFETLHSIGKTFDDGFILGGKSNSGISGDKTQPSWGLSDYWIIKTDSVGNQQWNRNFGGTDYDELISIQQTSDGGYILGGFTKSGISGDKTNICWGGFDYWIIKTDSLGNKQWDKDFGGNSDDFLVSIQQTTDGGYILGGSSTSGISGDKTQPIWGAVGGTDYWLIKTDSLGNKIWDIDLGGNDNDDLLCIQQTSNGGFIFGGRSSSGISGNKTQPSWGIGDYWIVKTDSQGIKQWDNDYGGTNDDWLSCIEYSSDNGFVLGGYSYSGIGGDKTQSNWDPSGSSYDFWIIKIDSLGNQQWDKDFGGTDYEDELGSISQTKDGGYFISGTSYSTMSGNKTENNLGGEQTWVIKIDSFGTKQWDKTVFTNGHDEQGLSIVLKDSCYLIANSSNGGNAGDKSQTSWGYYDYWIIKFCETLQANFTSPSSICPGTCVDFTNHSFQSTSYQWSFSGAIPDTSTNVNPQNICYANPGTYDVQLIASNANGSDTLLLTNYITVYPSPPPQSITQSGDTLFAIAGSASYQWYFNTNLINGATNYFYVAQASGDYNVVCTDANGCEVEAAVFNVVAGMLSTVDSGQWTIFPNPAEDQLIIHKAQGTSETATEISIYNVIGEKIFMAVDCLLPTVDCRLLLPGIYYIEITSCGKTFRSKFVKQ